MLAQSRWASIRIHVMILTAHLFVNYFTEDLELWGNTLQGTMPSEVGQLTALSEFSCACCHDMPSQSFGHSLVLI
jgi:hypothetical protein